MSPQRPNISLEGDDLSALKVLGATQGCSVATVTRETVDAHLREQFVGDAAWRMQVDDLLDRVRSRMDPAITPEENEADITEARDQIRKRRHVSRRR